MSREHLVEIESDQAVPSLSSSTPPPTQPTSTSTPTCSLCGVTASKYTCPQCLVRTCSLNCSTSHKSQTGCTGKRNKAKYVPMNEYGWGTMMDDFVFLEDVGRKVGEWGKEIVRGGYAGRGVGAAPIGRGRGGIIRGGASGGRGGRGGRGMGRVVFDHRGRPRGGMGPSTRSKRDILKMQLENLDIDLDLLATGMERRKHNQSIWDFKTRKARLTIEFKFHPALSSTSTEKSYVLLTHKNDSTLTLLNLLYTQLQGQSPKKHNAVPEWVKSLVSLDDTPAEEYSDPPPFQCVMRAPIDPASALLQHKQNTQLPSYLSNPTASFPFVLPPHLRQGQENLGHKPRTQPKSVEPHWYLLSTTQPLIAALKYMHFVEYPTIEIFEEFHGIVVEPQPGNLTKTRKVGEGGRERKRRKVDADAGKKAIEGLLGGYGSDSDEEMQEGPAEERKELKENVFSSLGDYGASDEEVDEQEDQEAGEDEGEQPHEVQVLEDSEDEEPELDPAAVLELLKRVRGIETTDDDGSWLKDAHVPGYHDSEEEQVDWGDSLEDEDGDGVGDEDN